MLNEKQRLEDYKNVLQTMIREKEQFNSVHGFCVNLNHSLTENNYPELMAYKPKWSPFLLIYYMGTFYWFPRNIWGYYKRIRILKKIIRKMENPHCKYYNTLSS